MALPGCFFVVNLGGSTLATPGIQNDVSGLNFAVVMEDGEEGTKQNPYRWSTWGLEADSLFLFQQQGRPNLVIVGNEGIIYKLDDKRITDDGVPIPVTWISAPLPTVDEKNVAATMTRTQEIKWSVRTKPPTLGLKVTVTLIDVDTGTTVSREVTQYTQKMHVKLTIRARQFRIRFDVSGSTDFDLAYLAYSYQTMSTRKTTAIS